MAISHSNAVGYATAEERDTKASQSQGLGDTVSTAPAVGAVGIITGSIQKKEEIYMPSGTLSSGSMHRLGRFVPLFFPLLMAGSLVGCRRSLHDAIESYDIELIVKLVEEGSDVNTRDSRGITAMHVAAISGRADVAELLVNMGADVEAGDNDGWTPLHAAAANGETSTPVARLLIAHGADVQALTNDGTTVLHEVGRGGDAWLAELLIKRGADVNAVHHSGDTPLHFAASSGNADSVQVARVLLASGANVWVRNKSGHTALEVALVSGNEGVAKLLAEAVDLSARDGSGDTRLHWAVRRHNPRLVRIFVEHGADINAKDGQGNTPLDVAYLIDNKDIIRFLLSKGAQGERKERPERGPIIGEQELLTEVRNIASQGGDLNRLESIGAPPLHLAAMYGYKSVVDFLLQHGVGVDSSAEGAPTALHAAAMYSQFEIAKILIDHGADVNAVAPEEGVTPLHSTLMAKEQNLDLVRLLLDSGANANAVTLEHRFTPLQLALWSKDAGPNIIDLLIEYGADINAGAGEAEQKPLHVCVSTGNIDMVRLLLARGADIEAHDKAGATALHYAARVGHKDIAGLLIDNSADVNAKDRGGKPPLVATFASSDDPNVQAVAELLREHGAKNFGWRKVE
jgi:ankyrin